MIHKRFSLFFFIRGSIGIWSWLWRQRKTFSAGLAAVDLALDIGRGGGARTLSIHSVHFFLCVFHLNKVSWLRCFAVEWNARAYMITTIKELFLHKLQIFYIHRISVRAHRNLIKLERICNRSPTRGDVENFPKDFLCIFSSYFPKKKHNTKFRHFTTNKKHRPRGGGAMQPWKSYFQCRLSVLRIFHIFTVQFFGRPDRSPLLL